MDFRPTRFSVEWGFQSYCFVGFVVYYKCLFFSSLTSLSFHPSKGILCTLMCFFWAQGLSKQPSMNVVLLFSRPMLPCLLCLGFQKHKTSILECINISDAPATMFSTCFWDIIFSRSLWMYMGIYINEKHKVIYFLWNY